MNTNNGFALGHEIFHIYSVLSSNFTHCVTCDYLQQRWSHGRFSMTAYRFLRNEKCLHRKPTITEHQMISTKHQILHSLQMYSMSTKGIRLSIQAFRRFRNLSAACASFSLSMKRRDDVMLICFHLSILCSFGYYKKIIKWIIVLEIYAT